MDLSWYDRFVPCGIADAGFTTLSEELGRDVPVAEVLPLVEKHLSEMLAWAPYEPTPDYAPRTEPGRRTSESADSEGLRVPVLNPLA